MDFVHLFEPKSTSTGQYRKANQADLIWCKLVQRKRNPHLLITFPAQHFFLSLFLIIQVTCLPCATGGNALYNQITLMDFDNNEAFQVIHRIGCLRTFPAQCSSGVCCGGRMPNIQPRLSILWVNLKANSSYSKAIKHAG